MAAGVAGDGMWMPDAEGIPDMVATMNRMMDSITTLQNQMAELLEDPGSFNRRHPDSLDTPIEDHDEKGPAIRERTYARAHEADRRQVEEMKEVINTNTSQMAEMAEMIRANNLTINELESALGFYSSELTADRDNFAKLSDAVNIIRSDTASSRASVTGAKEKSIVTSIRGFDKLKTYKGTVSEWKEWRFKLVTWLSQSSSSYETLIVKLDDC